MNFPSSGFELSSHDDERLCYFSARNGFQCIRAGFFQRNTPFSEICKVCFLDVGFASALQENQKKPIVTAISGHLERPDRPG